MLFVNAILRSNNVSSFDCRVYIIPKNGGYLQKNCTTCQIIMYKSRLSITVLYYLSNSKYSDKCKQTRW